MYESDGINSNVRWTPGDIPRFHGGLMIFIQQLEQFWRKKHDFDKNDVDDEDDYDYGNDGDNSDESDGDGDGDDDGNTRVGLLGSAAQSVR